jgi:eukaryotic-like serine/threonine-protein kinase
MTWRERLRRALLFVLVIVSGFLLAYLVVAFVVFPSGVVPGDVRVPNLVGLTVDDAERELEKVGLVMERGETRLHSGSPAGTVLEQVPAPGQREPEGTTVTLVLSGGQKNAEVPNVIGSRQADAETALETAGFTIGQVTELPSEQPRGEVIATRPIAGQQVTIPSAVALTVSSGPEGITVPDVLGFPAEQARRALEALGLSVDIEGAGDPRSLLEGTIEEQRPAGGTQVPRGSRITLRVRGLTP